MAGFIVKAEGTKMASTNSSPESGIERISRFGRNVNILGAIALTGLAVILPGPNAVLSTWVEVNILQAGAFEIMRGSAEKSRKHSL